MVLRNSVEFPYTVEAVENIEGGFWALADALVKECGKANTDNSSNNDGSYEKIRQADAELRGLGYSNYPFSTLIALRQIATNFPAKQRFRTKYPHMDWSIYDTLINPEFMKEYLKTVESRGITPTRDDAQAFVRYLERKSRSNWEVKWETERQEKRRALQQNIDTLVEQEQQATNDIERARIVRQRTRLEQKKHQLLNKKVPRVPRREIIVNRKVASGFKNAALVLGIESKLGRINTMTQKILQELEELLPKLDGTDANVIRELALKAHQQCLSVSNLASTKQVGRQAHITVVGSSTPTVE